MTKHGLTKYSHSECRCRVCQAAFAAYVADRRERRGFRSRSGYTGHAHPRPTVEQLRALYVEQGRSSEVLAVYFGVASQTVRNWLREGGITLRPSGRPRKADRQGDYGDNER